MRIKEGYIFRNIADDYIVVPIGEAADATKGLIHLSESGAFLWSLLKENKSEVELQNELVREYQIDKEIAKVDVTEFIDSLKELGCIEI